MSESSETVVVVVEGPGTGREGGGAPAGRHGASRPGRLARFLRPAGRFVGEMLVAFALSQVAQSFTDSALWLPKEWRYGVMFLVSFFAATLTELVRSLSRDVLPVRRAAGHAAEGGAAVVAGMVARRNARVRMVLALVFVAAAGVGLWQSYALRSQCVRPMTVTDAWWREQFGPNAGKPAAAADSGHGEAGHSAGDHGGHGAAGEILVPDFLNKERNTIYVPLAFDKEMGDYLRAVGGGDVERGIVSVLDGEPIRMVDWLRGPGAAYLRETTMRFMGWHLLMILSLAVAWGFHRMSKAHLVETVMHAGH